MKFDSTCYQNAAATKYFWFIRWRRVERTILWQTERKTNDNCCIVLWPENRFYSMNVWLARQMSQMEKQIKPCDFLSCRQADRTGLLLWFLLYLSNVRNGDVIMLKKDSVHLFSQHLSELGGGRCTVFSSRTRGRKFSHRLVTFLLNEW